MKIHPILLFISPLSVVVTPSVSAEAPPVRLEPLRVHANAYEQAWSLQQTEPDFTIQLTPDATSALRRLPGAAVSRNGPLTGQLQLRGVTGDRVGILVNGMTITPACPNHMDPPLHYAQLASDDLLKLYAGMAPVSEGGDRLGGSLRVESAAPEFAQESATATHGGISSGFSGDRDATLLRANLRQSNELLEFRYRGDAASAGNLRYPGGSVSASGYDSTRHETETFLRTSTGFWAVDAGMSFTRDAGTPALPMDMIRDDAWHLGLRQEETHAWGEIRQRLYVHDIDHLMDNYTQRKLGTGVMAMDAPATSRDFGWSADVMQQRGNDRLRTGLDFHRAEFDAEQVAVASGMRRDTFQNNRRSRTGLYGDWERDLTGGFKSRMGVRGDWVTSDADAVSNQIMPTTVLNADLNRFNSADRSKSDLLPSAMAGVEYSPEETTVFGVAGSLKSRAPSLVERYLWTPANASAGLADGRTYLGSLDLDPETALELSLSARKSGDGWNASVTPFYRAVNDFITGLPHATRKDAAGKPVLVFSNIDLAEFYGLECSARRDLAAGFSLECSASHTRARNQDQGGDLYRVAPLRGLIDLAWQQDAWESHLECEWADAQNHVAELQDEIPTAGYATWNFRLARKFASYGIRAEVGVENLLDHLYREHLGGINRVAGGDLGVGERIPSAGRFAYASLSWEF